MLSVKSNKLKKINFVFLLLLLVISLSKFNYSAAIQKKDGTKNKYYIIGVPSNNIPFEMEKNKKYSGIDIELLEEISKIEGFGIIWKPMDDRQLTENLESGKLDGIMDRTVTYNNSDSNVDFSDSYFSSGAVGVARVDNIYVNSVENFKGKMFGVLRNTEDEAYANSIKKKNEALVVPYDDILSLSKDLIDGELDIAFMDYPLVYYINNQNDSIKLKVLTEKVDEKKMVFEVKRGSNPELIQMFNDGLQKIKDNGKYYEIIQKYIGDGTFGFGN